jgi:hypothetical protein
VATCPAAEIRRATGLSVRYAIMIRQGYVPHPRHFTALAKLAGVPTPKALELVLILTGPIESERPSARIYCLEQDRAE